MIGDTIPDLSNSTRYMYFYVQNVDLSSPDRIETRPPGQTIYGISSIGDVDGDG